MQHVLACSRFDKHNDGNLNFRDFLMVVHLTSRGSAEDKLRTMFSLYDLDGNGSIDASELERYHYFDALMTIRIKHP